MSGSPGEAPRLPLSHPTPPPIDGPGPLLGIRVVELAHEFGAFAGKLLADAGADVIVVEPPGGAMTRSFGPFAEGVPEDAVARGEASLVWWADNTGKRSVIADLSSEVGREFFGALVGEADVVLECEPPGHLSDLGTDYSDFTEANDDLIWLSITPFGRSGPRCEDEMTDLTMLAGGGPLWSCGYDDHSLPPVRGGGNQGLRMTGNYAMMSVLTALLAREAHGGQHIDLNMHAAANVTTEFASYTWMAAQLTVQRQTGRHAAPDLSYPTQVQCSDGRYLNTGVPPRTPKEFAVLEGWLTELGLDGEFEMFDLLGLGADFEFLTLELITEDPLAGELFQAGREAVELIARRLTAHEAFLGLQTRGLAAGVVWSPDETMQDPHFVERGFPVSIEHELLGRSVVYPGAPIRLTGSPMRVSGRAPYLGEHDGEVRSELGRVVRKDSPRN